MVLTQLSAVPFRITSDTGPVLYDNTCYTSIDSTLAINRYKKLVQKKIRFAKGDDKYRWQKQLVYVKILINKHRFSIINSPAYHGVNSLYQSWYFKLSLSSY